MAKPRLFCFGLRHPADVSPLAVSSLPGRILFPAVSLGENRSDGFRGRSFHLINAIHRNDVSLSDHYPIEDESWKAPLLTAN